MEEVEKERGPKPSERVQPVCYVDAHCLEVPGLQLIKEFITEEEEAALMSHANSNAAAWQTLAKRRVQHYGYEFDYVKRNIDMSQPAASLPGWVQPLLRRFQKDQDLEKQEFDQLTVNEYRRGTGIAPHVDSHSAFTGSVLSLSCGGGTVMEFQRGESRRGLLLPPRSLLALSGEVRYAWRHYIPNRRSDMVEGAEVDRGECRLSFTFRLARGFPCEDCNFPEECDSRGGGAPPTRLEMLGLRGFSGAGVRGDGVGDSDVP